MELKIDRRMAYVQENSEYYLPKFAAMDSGGKKTSWNWAAFFFTDAWMLYRKMYKLFVITLIVQFIIATIFPGLSILIHILVGLFGNYLYKDHVDKLAETGSLLTGVEKESHAAKHGGTSQIAIAVYLILSLILAVLDSVLGMIIS